MIEETDLSDEEWANYWVRAQQRQLTVVNECIRQGSLRPRVDDMVQRAKAVYAFVRDRWQRAVDDADFAARAVEVGRQLGNPQLVQLAAKAAAGNERVVEIEHERLEAARDVVVPALAHAVTLLGRIERDEPPEPVYSRSNPRPGVPAWYYPEEGSTDDR
jgi:hypothetical protein